MTSLEELERLNREARAHIGSLTEALQGAQSKNVQLEAQVRYVRETAEYRLRQCGDLIDNLHNRIEFMVNTWQEHIRTRFTGSDEEKQELLELVEPFRPVRIGAATIDPVKV